jgi:hypothetical protein
MQQQRRPPNKLKRSTPRSENGWPARSLKRSLTRSGSSTVEASTGRTAESWVSLPPSSFFLFPRRRECRADRISSVLVVLLLLDICRTCSQGGRYRWVPRRWSVDQARVYRHLQGRRVGVALDLRLSKSYETSSPGRMERRSQMGRRCGIIEK